MARVIGKRVICVDFDGVVYPNMRYVGPTELPEAPVPGAEEGLRKLLEHHRVVCHSCRCETREGRLAIRGFLDSLGLQAVEVAEHKPVAAVYLDDRAVCFRGDWGAAVEEVATFAPWQRAAKLKAKLARKRARRRR